MASSSSSPGPTPVVAASRMRSGTIANCVLDTLGNFDVFGQELLDVFTP